MIKNAKEFAQRYFGLHFSEGLAEYGAHEGTAGRIFISNEVATQMDSTFSGKPIFVMHVDETDDAKLKHMAEEEADGVVVRSFYNKNDGKHWAEFMVQTDKGMEAIRKGWKLSNAYVVNSTRQGGKWHNVDYDSEVVAAEYKHLAIVPNPRYEESIVLTPEEFKTYNEKKAKEHEAHIANSKQEKPTMLNLWKRTKVENAADLSDVCVTLSTGKDIAIKDLVAAHETAIKNAEEAAKEGVMCNMEHLVQIGEAKMNVAELVEKYNAMLAEKAAPKAVEEPKNEEPKVEPKVEEKKNEEPKVEEKKEDVKSNAFAEMLKNAPFAKEVLTVETSADKVQRGRALYGSAKK